RTDLSASAGYGLVAGPAADGAWQVEHRAWQQVQVDARLAPEAPARLTGRLRLEQRDLPGGWDLRLRLLARGLLPVGRGGWGVSLWDEAFVTLDAPTAGFDQNRAFVGPYHQSAAGVRVEVGYLNLLRRDGTSGLTDSHVASLQVSVGLRPRR
ncbi:MAG TPA: DUF2490 domain-containing protein, partial [Myxococcota bacterium]|nr:DUF2490 domain-containing protein [Myxococcota bacterium]